MSEHKQTILVVDKDQKVTRALEAGILAINGDFAVQVTSDPTGAPAILENEKIDLMILAVPAPDNGGRQLLKDLSARGIWAPTIITASPGVDEKDPGFCEFGIVDFVTKPLEPKNIVTRINRIMKNREKKDLIQNFGLPSILQLIEMDKTTGVLTINIADQNGRIFFKHGRIMDVDVKGLSTAEALDRLVHTLYEDRKIRIEYINHRKSKNIDMSLMEIVMEASRIKDEKRIPQHEHAPHDPEAPEPNAGEDEQLPAITGLLDSLKEVRDYIVTDARGNVLAASPEDYNRTVLSVGVFLWITGSGVGGDLDLGGPRSLTCYLKGKKWFIRRYRDYVVMLVLTGITKSTVFKEKLAGHLDELSPTPEPTI